MNSDLDEDNMDTGDGVDDDLQGTVSSFEECVAAGNPVMESYPRQCQSGDEVFVEDINESDASNNTGDTVCTMEYAPVCASVQVECSRAPCPPINTTFTNACEAEKADAEILYEGECIDDSINLEGACLSFDGNWIEESQECEWMPEEMCINLGGKFDSCASACRNDPDAEICTKQCVMVCKFG